MNNLSKITPRNTNEGSIGTAEFNWGDSHFNSSTIQTLNVSGLYVSNSTDTPTFEDGTSTYFWAQGNNLYWGNAKISDGSNMSPNDLNLSQLETQPTNTNNLLYNYNGNLYYQDSIISNGTNNAAKKFTTGWIAGKDTDGNDIDLANGDRLTITHNLNTTDIVCQAFVSKPTQQIPTTTDYNSSAHSLFLSGPGSFTIDPETSRNGASFKTLTNDTINIQLGADGYLFLGDDGSITQESFAGAKIKVIVIG